VGWRILRSRKPDKMFPQSQTRWSCFCRRAAALQEMCYQWGGVISAAVYVPLLDGVLVPEDGAPKDWTVPGVIRHLSTFHRQMETEGERLSDGAFYCTLINSVWLGRTRLPTLIRNIKSSLSLATSTALKPFSISLHQRAGPCKLDMILYSEEVGSATMAAFYPVNALRNRALKQAKTEVR